MDATRSAVTLLGAALIAAVNVYFFGRRRAERGDTREDRSEVMAAYADSPGRDRAPT